MSFNRIIGEVDSVSSRLFSASLVTFADDGTEESRSHPIQRQGAEHGPWTPSASFATLQSLFNNGTPFLFQLEGVSGYYRSSRTTAADDSLTAAIPPRWMEEQHPFDPESEYDILEYDSYDALPTRGKPNKTYVVTDSGGQRHQLKWDEADDKYISLNYDGPRTEVQTYVVTSGQHHQLRSNSGSTAGQVVDGYQPLAITEPLKPGIPVTDLEATDVDGTHGGTNKQLEAHAEVNCNVTISATFDVDVGSESAAWYDSDASAAVLARAARYQFFCGLYKVSGGTSTLIHGETLSGSIGAATTGLSTGFGIANRPVQLQDGDSLRLQTYAGTGAHSTEGDLVSGGVTVNNASLAIKRYESALAQDADNADEVTAFEEATASGAVTPQTLAFDFDDPIDLTRHPIGHFTYRHQRPAADFRFHGTFDLRELDLAADAAAATAIIDATPEADRPKMLWLLFYAGERSFEILHMKPYDGWFHNYTDAHKLILYGSGDVVEGCVMRVWRGATDAVLRTTLKCRR